MTEPYVRRLDLPYTASQILPSLPKKRTSLFSIPP